jgi:hypothetical protein
MKRLLPSTSTRVTFGLLSCTSTSPFARERLALICITSSPSSLKKAPKNADTASDEICTVPILNVVSVRNGISVEMLFIAWNFASIFDSLISWSKGGNRADTLNVTSNDATGKL